MSGRLPRIAELTLALAAGIALGLRVHRGGAVALALAIAAAAAALLLPGRGSALHILLSAASGWALGAAAAAGAAADCRFHIPEGEPIRVRGAFEAAPWPGKAAPFHLRELGARGRVVECGGTIRVKPGERVRAPPAGAEVIGAGRWWVLPPQGRWPQPGERAGVLTLDSILGAAGPVSERLHAGGAGGASALRAGSGRHPLLRARGRAQALVRELFGRRAGLAESLILAQTGGLDPETSDRFAASGLSHLLSISGLHVGLAAAAILLLARAMRFPARPAAIGAAAATIGYVLFIGAPVPAVRSCVQLGLLLASRLLQRPADPRGMLAACALLVLVLSPISLLDPGFQLSFGGVLGLLLLRRRALVWAGVLRPKWLRESVATSLAATLATSPIAVAHFGRIAPVGVLANLVAVPLAGVAVPAIGLSLLTAAAAPAAGHFLAGGATLLLDALDLVARAAAAVPGGHALVPADEALAWALAAAAAVTVAGASVRLSGSTLRRPGMAPGQGRHSRRPAVMGAGTALALVLLWPVALRVAGSGRVEIWAIDVGQGDAIAIRSPAGRWFLVDAGPKDARFDAGRARVVPFLLAHGVHRLDALILTHADADHIGGVAAVLESVPVLEIIEPGLPAGRPLYLDAIRLARARGASWLAAREGRELVADGMAMRFLAPPRDGPGTDTETNEASVVFALRYGAFGALFMGDAPLDAEAALLAAEARAGAPLRVDVLKLGHHGSATSTGEALLEAARPRVALISVGRRNRFGHPSPEVLRRLARRGVRVYRTDVSGSVGVIAGADGAWRMETSR